MPEIDSCRHHSRVHQGVCAVLSPPPVYPSPPSTSPLATTGLFPIVKSVSWMVSLLKNSHFGGLQWPRIRKGFDPLKYPTQASLCCLQASSVLLFGPTSSCHHRPYFRTLLSGSSGLLRTLWPVLPARLHQFRAESHLGFRMRRKCIEARVASDGNSARLYLTTGEMLTSAAIGLLMLFTNLFTCSKCLVISVAKTMSIMAWRSVR